MHVLHKFDDSRFWQRLSRFDNDDYKDDRQAVRDLIAHVSKVAGQSGLILDQVSRFLMQYTLHNPRQGELRLEMKQKGEGVVSLVIGAWSLRFPGAARRQWLRVTDYSVSITEEVIKELLHADRQELLPQPGVQPRTSRYESRRQNHLADVSDASRPIDSYASV